jgi:hypothetical protein
MTASAVCKQPEKHGRKGSEIVEEGLRLGKAGEDQEGLTESGWPRVEITRNSQTHNTLYGCFL